MNNAPASSLFVAIAILACSGLLLPAPALGQEELRGATRLEVTAGSTAEYRVREQLARFNFPNDAVGRSDSLTGSVVVGPDGAIIGGKLSVDLRDLQSDADRRDRFLRENTLHTDRFPMAQFVPRQQRGLATPLPTSGKATFTLIGDMTIHGVTSETAWEVAAVFGPNAIDGRASTRFPFAKFGLTIPKVFGLLSVDDDIRLVLNFKATRTAPSVGSDE